MEVKRNGLTYTLKDTILTRAKVRKHEHQHGYCDLVDFAIFHIKVDGAPPSNMPGLERARMEEFLESEEGEAIALEVEQKHITYYQVKEEVEKASQYFRDNPEAYKKFQEANKANSDIIEDSKKKPLETDLPTETPRS